MPEPNSKTFERLPKSVVPNHYNIRLQPDLQEFTFTGESSTQVEVTSPVTKVLLNALELKISEAQFTDPSGQVQQSKSIELNSEDELAVISFESPLPVGKGELSMKFQGELNDLLKGFYRSKYFTSDGEQRYCACTHFESTDARRAFPCWDEPALKATFDITLVVPKDRLALSNMNVTSDKLIGPKEELREVKFARSPVMSTYLVAFVVGEFDYVEEFSADGIHVRVYTPVGKKEQGKFALEVAARSLPFFKDYFNIAYPLPKMDLIALADFAFGAMENWGLVTYRETCLLLDPQNTSTLRKQQIANTVAHELAHQWFGNLVTMEWWTHLWLNEGFATFMQFLCVHFLFPEFDIWTQFISNTFSCALELDTLNNSHPVEVPVSHPHEIEEIFDDISYKKGASIIRMLNKFLSDEVFRKGLHGYLKKHAYANCSTEHLWEALEEASSKPVASMMTTWTQQKGFPYITVSCKTDGSTHVLTLTQEKFHVGNKATSLWVIPISIGTSGNLETPAKQLLLDAQTTEVVLENVPKDNWIIVNPGSVGFYRVMYSEEMMSQLVPGIADQSLPPIDRLSIQNDLFAMVQAGKASSLEILKLLEVYEKETNYTVWTSISGCLGKLNLLLSHLDFQDLFYRYCRQLFTAIHSKLGWDPVKGESHTDALLRGLVISWLALAQDEPVLAEARRRFEAHANNISILPADLRNVVYKSAASQGDSKTFVTLLRLYREADLQEEKNRLSMALGSFHNKEYIQKVLEFSLSSEVRSQDAVFVISSVARTKPGRDMAWNFFQSKKDELLTKYQSSYLLSWLIKEVLENFASEEKAQEIETFFMKNHFPGTNRSVQQALETIRLHARWLERDQDVIKTYLSSRQ